MEETNSTSPLELKELTMEQLNAFHKYHFNLYTDVFRQLQNSWEKCEAIRNEINNRISNDLINPKDRRISEEQKTKEIKQIIEEADKLTPAYKNKQK